MSCSTEQNLKPETCNLDLETYPPLGKQKNAAALLLAAFLLSIQDSNLDWLIQSQMCYHYTNGQSRVVSFEIGCKSTTFFAYSKIFFCFSLLCGLEGLIYRWLLGEKIVGMGMGNPAEGGSAGLEL